MLELGIIPQNGEYIDYKIKGKDKKDGHVVGLEKYIEENNIKIESYKYKTSYQISIDLARLGISTLHYENRFLQVYLPEKLTYEQAKRYYSLLKIFPKFKISFLEVMQDEEKQKDPVDYDENKSQLKEFYKTIKSKIKEAKKEKGEKNANGPIIQ